MKKKLFKKFDEEFWFLCKYPDYNGHFDYLSAILSFLVSTGVITGTEYRFLTFALYAVVDC